MALPRLLPYCIPRRVLEAVVAASTLCASALLASGCTQYKPSERARTEVSKLNEESPTCPAGLGFCHLAGGFDSADVFATHLAARLSFVTYLDGDALAKAIARLRADTGAKAGDGFHRVFVSSDTSVRADVFIDDGVRVVAFRGTQIGSDPVIAYKNLIEHDLSGAPLPFREPGWGNIHFGFWRAWTAIRDTGTDSSGASFSSELSSLFSSRGTEKVIFTGHSLGAAIAILAAADRSFAVPDSVVTFGSPLVGDAAFEEAYARAGLSARTEGYTYRYDTIALLPFGGEGRTFTGLTARAFMRGFIGALGIFTGGILVESYRHVGGRHWYHRDEKGSLTLLRGIDPDTSREVEFARFDAFVEAARGWAGETFTKDPATRLPSKVSDVLMTAFMKDHMSYPGVTADNPAIRAVYAKLSTPQPVGGEFPLLAARQRVTSKHMRAFLDARNPGASTRFVHTDQADIVQLYLEESLLEGVSPEVAFVQMIHSTDALVFGKPDLPPHLYNFSGVRDLTGDLARFPDMRMGVRAHVQQLKAYADKEPLSRPVVAPRFTFVTRGAGVTVEAMARRWSQDADYGKKILDLLGELLSE